VAGDKTEAIGGAIQIVLGTGWPLTIRSCWQGPWRRYGTRWSEGHYRCIGLPGKFALTDLQRACEAILAACRT
jgi:hypothetical protein